MCYHECDRERGDRAGILRSLRCQRNVFRVSDTSSKSPRLKGVRQLCL